MNFMGRGQVEALKAKYTRGTRVELLAPMDDPYSKLRAYDRGTVTGVDDIGSIHVCWDKGSSLALIYGVDSFRKICGEEKSV